MTINFPVSLGEVVRIREIDRPGIVVALMVSPEGVEMKVAYWHEGRRYQEWLHAGELFDAVGNPLARTSARATARM